MAKLTDPDEFGEIKTGTIEIKLKHGEGTPKTRAEMNMELLGYKCKKQCCTSHQKQARS